MLPEILALPFLTGAMIWMVHFAGWICIMAMLFKNPPVDYRLTLKWKRLFRICIWTIGVVTILITAGATLERDGIGLMLLQIVFGAIACFYIAWRANLDRSIARMH